MRSDGSCSQVSRAPLGSKEKGLRRGFVRRFWATHNDSATVRRALAGVLQALGADAIGLNVGCGDTRLDDRLIHVDLTPTAAVDCIADAQSLPFAAGSFQCVVSQETVEHLADPFQAVREMARVLKPGCTLYLQAPFIIGYHPGPEDYWRFTQAGMRRLVEQAGLLAERLAPAVGAGTGFHRILVEFIAGGAARLLSAAYLPVKGLAAMLLYPIKSLDRWLDGGAQRDRIPGGYFVVARKPE